VRFGFFVGVAQAFATVGQVQAHGGPGSVRILAGNGGVDFFVLTAQAIHVLALVIMGQAGGVETGARDDAGAQVGHDVGEVTVARRQCNLQMKLEIRGHRIAVTGGIFVQGIQCRAHRGQLLVVASLSGQPR